MQNQNKPGSLEQKNLVDSNGSKSYNNNTFKTFMIWHNRFAISIQKFLKCIERRRLHHYETDKPQRIASMSSYPPNIVIEEQGLRDGLQSERPFIPTAKKLEIVGLPTGQGFVINQ